MLTIKQKKNRRFDLNEVKMVGLHLLDGVNEWNASKVLNILFDKRDKCKHEQTLFLLFFSVAGAAR